jgi:glyoxylate/hydroxypyruvate reductase A
MDILFASTVDDSAEWTAALKTVLPQARLHVWPDLPDPAAVDYALVWRPPAGLLAGLPNLKAIFSLGAGVDGVFADPTLPPTVPLVRMVDEGLTAGMTEYVVWQVLAWHRRAGEYRAQQAAAVWRPRAQKLAGERTVGVLGLGVLGAAAAGALRDLGFRVLGWARTAKEVPGIGVHAGRAQFGAMLAQCECLVCLLPLTQETRGILDRSAFALLPRGAHVINAARGGHLVEGDLLAALADGHVAGAALDVFADEPLPPDHPFWHHPRIAVTPHVASVTHARTAVRSLADNIARLERGEAPLHRVDRGRGY